MTQKLKKLKRKLLITTPEFNKLTAEKILMQD